VSALASIPDILVLIVAAAAIADAAVRFANGKGRALDILAIVFAFRVAWGVLV